MPAKGNTWTDALVDLVFNNANAANIGDATGLRGSSAAGTLYVSLHTASPGAAGNQGTNEIAYTTYARVGVNRSGGAWVRTAESVSPAAAITFPPCTAGSGTATHFGVGTASAGAGELLYFGPITPNIAVAAGVTPQLTSATAITES